MTAHTPITGLILAGGRGSRMGGVDKGLAEFRGRPMVSWVVAALRPQVASLIINANRHPEAYGAWSECVVADEQPDQFRGPLAGVLAGLRACHTPWLVTAPCDSPFVAHDLVARLAKAAREARVPLAMACTRGDDGSIQHESVFALWHVSLTDALADFLASGRARIDAFTHSHGCVDVVFDDPQPFANLNTPEDLQG